MTVSYPVDETASGTAGPTIWLSSVRYALNSTTTNLSFAWTVERLYAASGPQWQFRYLDASGTGMTGTGAIANPPVGTSSGTYTRSDVQQFWGLGARYWRLQFNTGTAFTGAWSSHITGTMTEIGATVTPCQFGTRPTSSAPAIAFVTDATIAAACTLIGAPWLAVLFAPLIGYALDTGVLCGTGPPSMPTITNQDLLSSVQSRLQALQSTLWYSLCECIPGTPAPTPFPPPTLTQPSGWPPAPVYSCDPANLCATLTLILKRLDQLSSATAEIVDLATAVQRFSVPFAYVSSTVHAGLTGQGSVSVSRLIGMRIQVTAGLPGRQLEGNPPYFWNLGWLSISEGGRMITEHRLSQSVLDWLPEDMQLATTFSYWLYPGVTVQVTELLPEK